MKEVCHSGLSMLSFITAARDMEEREGWRKAAGEGRKGKGMNTRKEKNETDHLQRKIWVHLESVGVRTLQVMKGGRV